MKRFTNWYLTLALLLGTGAALAQPPDFAIYPGDDGKHHRLRSPEDRLARIAEFLELSESQTVEWQAIVEEHIGQAESRHQELIELREEFEALADREDPDLTALGSIALELHREMKSIRSGREDLVAELGTLLTPDQMERFEALQAARELGGPGGRRHGRRQRTDGDPD